MENKLTAQSLFSQDDVKAKFEKLLGRKSQGFITSVLQIVNSSELLRNADPMSIYSVAATAAALDLPLNNSLGMAYIIPFKTKQKDGSFKQVAQFVLGYKAYIQLAQRSGQFKTISATAIYDKQLIESDPLTGYKFDFTKKSSNKIIGYAGYFELLNGFQKTVYMTVDELKKHGLRFSQTYKKGFGLWKDDFDSMCIKTVIKLLLSKYAPLSIEMQRAVISDQSLINNSETIDVEYIDNTGKTPEEISESVENTKKNLKEKEETKPDLP